MKSPSMLALFAVTKEGNFLNRDFVFDAWIKLDEKSPKSCIGLGQELTQPVSEAR
jgi:hypothetical protein